MRLITHAKERAALTTWLDQKFEFTHHVTLATNGPGLSRDQLRTLIRVWDAKMNRSMYGPKWRKHYDELLFWFGFMEKPDVNPHWHLLIRLNDADPIRLDALERKLSALSEPHWQSRVPAGSVAVKTITSRHDRVVDYVGKELAFDVQYKDFITPDEFRRFE